MFILSLIGIGIIAMLIYGFIEWFNKYSFEKERYRFFTTEHTIAFVASYLIMFIGYIAIKNNWLHDWKNGAVIMLIGTIIFVLSIRNNFKHTSRSLAIKGSILQVILYIPIAIVGIFILIAAYAFFAQTKPVYNINSKD
jgi:hypothetical protein